MRVRVRYTKTGKLRFISAIDLGRVWERALRKANVPIAYSEGFSPHPKMSFPDALPLGYASTGEYAEFTFAAPVELDATVKALNAALPDGAEVRTAVEVEANAPKLARLLTASCWDLEYGDAAASLLPDAVAAALAAPALPVQRARKDDVVAADARPAIHQLSLRGATVRVVLHHTEPPLRPSEVHQALAGVAPASAADALPEPALATRVAQGAPVDAGLQEALSGEVIPPLASPFLPRESETA